MTKLDRHDVYWIKRRIPRPLLEMMLRHKHALVLAGGFIRACVATEPPNDIDLFTSSSEKARELANEAAGWKGCKMVETPNAFTVLGLSMPVQFIHRWSFETPEKIVPSFDFTIARAAVWFGDEQDDDRHTLLSSICDDRFYGDLAARRLVYCNPERDEDAGGSMLRILKFYQRGYRVPLDSLASVMSRMTMALGMFGLSQESIVTNYTKMLRDVDPNVDPEHLMHLPAIGAV